MKAKNKKDIKLEKEVFKVKFKLIWKTPRSRWRSDIARKNKTTIKAVAATTTPNDGNKANI